MSAGPDTPCARILERVSAYLDQELDRETCRTIEEHCSSCEDCRRLVDSLRETIGLCRATGERPLPPPLKAKARASIERLLSDMRRS